MTNKELLERHPFLTPRNVWTDEVVELEDGEEHTLLDEMPQGWRIAFGEQMCEEIREALIKADCLDEYRIMQIKEKYGSLRWYDGGAPREVHEIIRKYERLSERTCIHCGKPATQISTGWISPFCDECVENNPYKAYKHYVPIEEWFKEEE